MKRREHHQLDHARRRRVARPGFRTAFPAALLVTVVAVAASAAPAAAPTITIQLRPDVVPWTVAARLSGTVSSGRAEETVEIEARRCVDTRFSAAGEARTGTGGTWSLEVGATANTTYRARWRGATSDEVVLRTRPGLTLRQITARRFRVAILAVQHFKGKRATLQRFDRRRGWLAVRSFTIDEGGATTGFTVWGAGEVRARIPRGTLVRVVLPRSQTGRCYLAGYSNMLRT